MRRTAMWLNLYGREAVRHKLKNGLKHKKCTFCLFLSQMKFLKDAVITVGVSFRFCSSFSVITIQNFRFSLLLGPVLQLSSVQTKHNEGFSKLNYLLAKV